jgi:ABC-type hemin transport system ATPase subunit
VKDIYPVRTKEQESDVCAVLIAGIDIKRETTGNAAAENADDFVLMNTNGKVTANNVSKDNILNEEITKAANNESNITVKSKHENDSNATKSEEKNLLQKIIEFFRRIF